MSFNAAESLSDVINDSRECIVRSLENRLNKKYSSRFSGEDVFQIACEKVTKRLDEFRGTTKAELAAWLGSVAYCQLINELDRANAKKRCLQSTTEYLDVVTSDVAPSSLDSLADEEEARQAVQQLLAFVAELPPRQRMCIHLRFFERLSNDEVAKRLDMHIEAVKGLTKRGLHNLRAKNTLQCSRDVISRANEILQSSETVA